MINARVVVDGSNIATEGRTLPSLSQLDEAVRAFLAEVPESEVTVVVDATFGHRIDDSEKAAYEEAVLAGELVSPPAGAIGRGDAFVLSIANRADATIFSNDSFQEFHGQYEWLFTEGRLIGGKPVPGVGWVFVLRSPVRGPISRRSTREARAPKPAKAAPAPATDARKKAKAESSGVAADANAAAKTDGAGGTGGGRGRSSRRRRGGGGSGASTPVSASKAAGAAINEPGPYLAFVTAHPLGSTVDGTVDRFSSHGAYVVVEGTQCYLALRSMAVPPPKSAKEVLAVGESRSFVVQSFDSPRRSIDLAIPGFDSAAPAQARADAPTEHISPAQEAPSMAVAKKAPAKKAAAKKAPAKKAPAKKAVAKKAVAKKAVAKKTVAKKAVAKKAVAKKAAAKKVVAKKTVVKKAAAKKAPVRPASKAVKKAAPKKAVAKKMPAKKSGRR
jgi:hypothetical protein